ncbi:hypothetical protein CMU94_01855 [Elizabethkingia anophelis]|nr:hypothetical protein [Elizabethkingia anophelis]
MNTIGERIEYLMKLEDIDTKMISELTGIVYSNMRRYLTGDVNIPINTLELLVRHFPDWNLNWIIKGVGEPKLGINVKSELIESNNDPIIYGEDADGYVWLETKKIPEKAALSLVSNYFDDEYYNGLEKGRVRVKKEHKGEYYEVDCVGDSMNDGTYRSILDKDRLLVRDVKRQYWKNKLHNHKWDLFYFLHNERRAIVKQVKSHNPETGEIVLHSWNPNKEEFPDFTINVRDCYIIANVVKLLDRDFASI